MKEASMILPSIDTRLFVRALALVWLLNLTATTSAQDLLGDTINFSGATLHLQRYVDPGPQNQLISVTTQPANTGNNNLFVTAQAGAVYSITNNNGSVTSTEWFNYNNAVNASNAINNASNGFELDTSNFAHGGLRAVAFHPEFATNGKFYTSALVDLPNGVSGLNRLGPTLSNPAAESLVAEWTYDSINGQVDVDSYRELFRVQMPVFDHPIKQIGFNNFSEPGDEDYGLLYIAHGDGSMQSATAGGGLVTNDALGKVLRVNPLQSGNDPYTTPNNPFVGIAGTLDEIYTLGHRNPHHLSFAEDSNGNGRAIIAEAGRDNVEEINLLQSGGSYGWSDREGTFVHNNNTPGYGLGIGVSSLPANEWQLNDYIYPAAQFDHDTTPGEFFIGSAVAGGFVIQNNSDPALQNQYIFADFGSHTGNVYQADYADILNAHTQLADGEAPSALTQAPISRLQLTLDSNGDGTIDNTADNLNTLLGQSRNDVRFGRGPNGEMFITSKRTGLVYLVTNTIANDLLTLSIDRSTGVGSISNLASVDIDIDGIRLQSLSGSLNPSEFQALAEGWTLPASNTTQNLAQLNEDSSLLFDDSTPVSLGDIYNQQSLAFGQAAIEDILFTYTGPNDESQVGRVVYEGDPAEPNTLVLSINLATGEATITNPTEFMPEVDAYTITSESGSLNIEGWETFESQGIDDGDWSASQNASATRLTEVQENGTTTFDNLTPFELGQIFIGGEQDFLFQFLLEGEDIPMDGVVVFELPGDFDGDNSVNGADFLAWQRGDSLSSLSSADLADWQENFGRSVITNGSVSSANTVVPESSAIALLLIATTLMVTCTRPTTSRLCGGP